MRVLSKVRHLAAAGVLLATALAARPAGAIVVERVVAIVGDRPILLSELRERAHPFLAQVQAKVPPGAQQAAAESQVLRELIEKMIQDELIAQAAEKATITVTTDEIDNALRNIAAAARTNVPEIIRLARTTSGLSEPEYRAEIRRQILEGKMLQLRVKGRIRITEADVQSAFDRALREERHRREYHPAWVVLRIVPGSSPDAIEERWALARDIAARAARGEDFASLAKRFSDDSPTRELGGDLGIRAPNGTQAAATGRRPVMAQELEAALLQLEPGGVSRPVRAGDAIVVMKLLSRQASRFTTLEAARLEILQRLQSEILEKAKHKWLDELRRRTHLDVRL